MAQKKIDEERHGQQLARIKSDTQSVLAPSLLHDPRILENVRMVHLCHVLYLVSPKMEEQRESFLTQQKQEAQAHAAQLARIKVDTQSVLAPTLLHDPRVKEFVRAVLPPSLIILCSTPPSSPSLSPMFTLLEFRGS